MDGGHGGHGDHGGMPAMCSMNMLFNWQVENLCVVFRWWHIKSSFGLVISCIIIFAIAAAYEYIRAKSSDLDQKLYEANVKKRVGEEADPVEQGLLTRGTSAPVRLSKQQELVRSALYATLVAISFWLMLVFMTYNGYLMIAVVLGAGFGHFAFGQGKLAADRSIQCH